MKMNINIGVEILTGIPEVFEEVAGLDRNLGRGARCP
jgi:hypothetical protein